MNRNEPRNQQRAENKESKVGHLVKPDSKTVARRGEVLVNREDRNRSSQGGRTGSCIPATYRDRNQEKENDPGKIVIVCLERQC